MRNKIGFLAAMALAFSAISFKTRRKGSDPYQPEAPLPTGEVHITSMGKRRPFVRIPKLRDPEKVARHQAMVEELKEQGVIWHNNKLYWATRHLAIQNS